VKKGTSCRTGYEKRSIDMHIYVYTHTYICTSTYHYISIHTWKCGKRNIKRYRMWKKIYRYAYIRIQTYIHMYTYISLYLYIPGNVKKGTSSRTGYEKRCIDMHIYVYTHKYICIYTHIYIYTYLEMRKKEHKVVQAIVPNNGLLRCRQHFENPQKSCFIAELFELLFLLFKHRKGSARYEVATISRLLKL